MSNITVITHSREETEQFAKGLAENTKAGTVFAMRGDLGAGKTFLPVGLLKV